MQELRDALINETKSGAATPGPSIPELQEAAEKWAIHSLRMYEGDLLEAALAISRALVQFQFVMLQSEEES